MRKISFKVKKNQQLLTEQFSHYHKLTIKQLQRKLCHKFRRKKVKKDVKWRQKKNKMAPKPKNLNPNPPGGRFSHTMKLCLLHVIQFSPGIILISPFFSEDEDEETKGSYKNRSSEKSHKKATRDED